ncbi:MAG: ABC transporter substrate-binding protein [Gammaproteobacteria bacterium]|nr:ABC transporter substrate-binding protein [Gammaproteobacteria bacterium]
MLTLFKQINIMFLSLFFSMTLLANITYADSIPIPQKLMEEASQQMVSEFINNAEAIKKNPDIAHDLIKKNLVPKVNFPLISRWVLGKNWRTASPAQKKEFQNEFQILVIQFYSEALLQFLQDNDINKDMIKFLPFRGSRKGKYATVRSQIYPPSGGSTVKVNYELYHGKSGQWQVYDVKIEGISLVSTYRSSFNNIITKKGIEGLILELKNKNELQATNS